MFPSPRDNDTPAPRSWRERAGRAFGLAVAYCEPTDLLRLPDYLKPRDPMQFAAQVVAALSSYWQQSDHWKVLRRLDLPPFRPVYVFQYSPRPLTPAEKWADVERTPPEPAGLSTEY